MHCLNPIPTNAPDKFKATAVIVLYGMSPEASPAFRSLLEALKRIPPLQADVSILLWDNSAALPRAAHLPNRVLYHHDPSNPGLAAAYNQAIEIAIEQQSHWLITLDQDTTVLRDYLLRMASATHLCACHPGVAAIVPQIAVGRKQLSPNRFAFGAIPRWYGSGFRGAPDHLVSAFNSGAMLRVDALRQIGGYDLRFPIEYSDAVMFHNLHQHGKLVYIEGNIQLGHELSLLEMNQRLSNDRYRRMLFTETAFWDLYMNSLAGCERTARLALRMIRHWFRSDRRELRRITREFLIYRLFHSKKARLRRWRDALNLKALPQVTLAAQTKSRPKVSVCMAAFNGARFIQAQLESILSQLEPDDEVVIVDDGSRDRTIARILALGDARIRLFAHERNQGVVATFEDALRAATGDILFLSDDDDLWAPTKVHRILREFSEHPEANIVTSRVALIDERGGLLPDARVNRYGQFLPGFWRNVFKNHYQGSAMAIRASFLGQILPFPRANLFTCESRFLHDVWIGTRNDAVGGQTVFIDEPLVFYRRHAQNASRKHSFLGRIQVRIDLLLAHLTHAFSAFSFR